jgi:hypothetical protein
MLSQFQIFVSNIPQWLNFTFILCTICNILVDTQCFNNLVAKYWYDTIFLDIYETVSVGSEFIETMTWLRKQKQWHYIDGWKYFFVYNFGCESHPDSMASGTGGPGSNPAGYSFLENIAMLVSIMELIRIFYLFK